MKVVKFEEKKLSLSPAEVNELQSLKSLAVLKKKTIEELVKLAAVSILYFLVICTISCRNFWNFL